MPRPTKCRRVQAEPQVTYFKPAGIPKHELDELVLSVDALEAIRLKDLEGFDQEECAEKMQVSRPTFQRILINARRVIAEAIIMGKAVRVEGGHYDLGRCHCARCSHDFPHQGRHQHCPACGETVEQDSGNKKR
jgi:uncharacterized protein